MVQVWSVKGFKTARMCLGIETWLRLELMFNILLLFEDFLKTVKMLKFCHLYAGEKKSSWVEPFLLYLVIILFGEKLSFVRVVSLDNWIASFFFVKIQWSQNIRSYIADTGWKEIAGFNRHPSFYRINRLMWSHKDKALLITLNKW